MLFNPPLIISRQLNFQVGWTPLIIASSAGRDEIVAYLLDCHGVKASAVNSTGQCALHYAASKDRFKVMQQSDDIVS